MKWKRIKRIIGEIPLFYNKNTIYVMCITINALVDAVNNLAERLEKLDGDSHDA